PLPLHDALPLWSRPPPPVRGGGGPCRAQRAAGHEGNSRLRAAGAAGRMESARPAGAAGGHAMATTPAPSIGTRASAEFLGTFWLVFGGCGSAVLAAAFPEVGIGLLGVALAFGLTVLTMAYAIGHVSGAHLNPAVSVGLVAGGRFPASELVPYVIAQLAGAIAAAAVLYLIATGKAGFDVAASGFAANGYGDHSPGGYSLAAALVAEVVLTFMFLTIILGATDARAPVHFAPLA